MALGGQRAFAALLSHMMGHYSDQLWGWALACVWCRTSKDKLAEVMTRVGKLVEGWIPKAMWDLRSLTIDIKEVLRHDHGSLVNGFARTIENPTWGWAGGIGECSGPALDLSLLPTSHTTTSSHLPSTCQMLCLLPPQPSVTPVTVPLGVFLSFLETFIGKALAQNNHSNEVT